MSTTITVNIFLLVAIYVCSLFLVAIYYYYNGVHKALLQCRKELEELLNNEKYSRFYADLKKMKDRVSDEIKELNNERTN